MLSRGQLLVLKALENQNVPHSEEELFAIEDLPVYLEGEDIPIFDENYELDNRNTTKEHENVNATDNDTQGGENIAIKEQTTEYNYDEENNQAEDNDQDEDGNQVEDNEQNGNYNPDEDNDQDEGDNQVEDNDQSEDYNPDEDNDQDEGDNQVEDNDQSEDYNPDEDNDQDEDNNQVEDNDQPEGQLSGRKRLLTRQERLLNKRLRMHGESYKGLVKDENGKYRLINNISARQLGPPCTSQKCRASKIFHCNSFSENIRKEIFNKFWKDLSWDMKRTYISTLVDSIPAKRKKQDSRRSETLVYSLKNGTEKLRVCKRMFLSTLGVNEWMVREYSSKDFGINMPDETKTVEKRGRSNRARKDLLSGFLDRLEKMPSHYCRASTSKLYLEPIFQSKHDVYVAYLQYCNENNELNPLSEKILMVEMKQKNLKLYRPRKDQCDICIEHKHGNVSDEVYSGHQKRKEMARSEKEADKVTCKESNGTVAVFTFDTEAVKLAPMLKASAIYYKKKLCIHNYTIYNLLNGAVMCYLWDETQGGLEANIFATMLTDYLSSYIETNPDTKEIIIYSDGCGYQNKNCLLSNAILKFSVDNKVTIYQKFFEKGHSQMEVDSVHSNIERRLKNRDIYLPTDYIAIIREARRKDPYLVKYMSYEDFKDFSNVVYYSTIRPGYKLGDPKVTDIHCLMYLPSLEIKYKINYDDNWKEFPKRPKPSTGIIRQLYKSRIKINLDKYQNLQALKCVLDKQFWDYYDNIPHH